METEWEWQPLRKFFCFLREVDTLFSPDTEFPFLIQGSCVLLITEITEILGSIVVGRTVCLQKEGF